MTGYRPSILHSYKPSPSVQPIYVASNFLTIRSRLFSAFFVLNACRFPLITMICFLIFSKDKYRDEADELSSVTLCGRRSCSLTKQDETDRVELIAKPCLLGKCLSFPFSFLSQDDEILDET